MSEPTVPTATRRRGITRGLSSLHVGAEYTPDELEWLRAIQWLKAHGQPRPDPTVLLWLIRALGYRRVASPAPEYAALVPARRPG